MEILKCLFTVFNNSGKIIISAYQWLVTPTKNSHYSIFNRPPFDAGSQGEGEGKILA